MKEAKSEAESQIAQYRAELEADYQTKLASVSSIFITTTIVATISTR